MKTLACSDVGFNCPTVIKGETEEELMQKAAEHASKDHNIRPEDMTSEMQQKIRGQIKSS
jgi:predicted small metal-binding protein